MQDRREWGPTQPQRHPSTSDENPPWHRSSFVITYHLNILEKGSISVNTFSFFFLERLRLWHEIMARSVENFRDSLQMDDIGLERLNQPLPLRSDDLYDSMYTPTKASSYQVTERESEVGRGTTDQDRYSLLHKRGMFNQSRSHGTISQRYVHWLYPTFMALSFLAGLILAVGHHIYYRWLNGQPVGSVTRQQWSLR